MPGFAYTQVSPTGGNRLRHFINLAGADRLTWAGTFTLPTSGSVTVTGIPFEPEALVCFGISTTSVFTDYARFHLGVAAGGSQWGLGIYGNYLGHAGVPRPWKNSMHRNDRIIAGIQGFDPDAGQEFSSTLTSFNSDGFTITVGVAHGSAISVHYLAMAGEGDYACGTALAPSGTGIQSISGLGFEATSIMLATVQQVALGYFSGFHRLAIGAGDIEVNTNVWSGTESSDPYHDSIATTDKILSMFRETNASGPFDPALLTEAELDATDSDGFDLNWTAADGTQRYYSWFAIGGETQVGWWNYRTALTGPVVNFQTTKKVLTKKVPKGLITYANDLGTTTRDYPSTDGDAMGFAVCDEAFTQNIAEYMTVGAGVIGGNQINSCNQKAYGLGSHQRRAGGIFSLAPNSGHDEGIIVKWIPKDIQQIIRYRW